MNFHHLRLGAPLLALGLLAGPVGAVSLGMVDDFQSGTTQGWGSGAAHPVPPVNVADGGPLGAGDAFLQATSLGVFGPGGKLVVFGGPQWGGDYLAAGVTSIGMDLSNLGSTDLSLRLLFESTSFGSAYSLAPVLLPQGGGWTHVSFAVSSDALSGISATDVLGDVTRLRLYHGDEAGFPGEDIVAQLGIDNVTAVPEPAGWAMLACGLAALLAGHGLRRRRP